MTLQSGTNLSTYEIVGHLGTGGMGVVYRARDTKLGREVAIKLLPHGFTEDQGSGNRLAREARILASLNHPNIATLYGFEAEGDTQFLVMELVEGETLAEWISRGPIAINKALILFLQIAEAIEVAHGAGVIHRDLKPGNIKVIRDDRIKVLDFGLARVLAPDSETSAVDSPSRSSTSSADSNSEEEGTLAAFPFATLSPGTIPTSLTKTGTVMGTPGYMSPEQAVGDPVGKPTDIWAFGCCLFEALTGSRAFAGETLQQAVTATLAGQPDWAKLDHIPTTLRDLIHHCLAQNPEERTVSFTDVLPRLRATQLGTPGPGALDVPPTPQSLEQRLFDRSRDMLCVAGIDGFLKRVNPAFERTLGWSAQELYSRPFVDFIHEEDRDATVQEMGRLAKGIPTLSFSNRYECRDGTYRRLFWTAELELDTGLLYGVARFTPGIEGDEGSR